MKTQYKPELFAETGASIAQKEYIKILNDIRQNGGDRRTTPINKKIFRYQGCMLKQAGSKGNYHSLWTKEK